MWPAGFARPTAWDFHVYTCQNPASVTQGWYAYRRPAGASMLFILIIGAGGGGGKGNGGASSSAPGGGGSGGTARLMIPTLFLPDVLYVRPGLGGAGATVAGAGGDGSQSYVAIAPTGVTNTILCTVLGGSGSVGTANTAGAAGAQPSSAGGPFIGCGLWTSRNGQAGTAGASNGTGSGTNVSPGNDGHFVTGGSGGGCGTGAGGTIAANGVPWPMSHAGGTNSGGRGRDGWLSRSILNWGSFGHPFLLTGGTGGGGHTSGVAGNGGNGQWGCGGGGGGNTNNAAGTAGNGGAGGDALIMIGAF